MRLIFHTTIIFIFILVQFIFGQVLYNGVGHIPLNFQVEWNNAGLLQNTPHQADYLYDVSQESGSSWDQKVNSAIQKAKNNNGVSIIYFPAGTYRLNSTITLTHNYGNNIIFQGNGSNNTVLEFDVGSNNNCFNFSGTT